MNKASNEGASIIEEIAGIPEGQLVKVNLKDPNDPGFRAFATIVFQLLEKAREVEKQVKGERSEVEGSLLPNTLHLTPQKKVTDPPKCSPQTQASSGSGVSASSPPLPLYDFDDAKSLGTRNPCDDGDLKNEGSQKRGVFGRPRKPRSSMDLKNARLQKGLTQREVARALKITRGTYANVERGLKPIPEQWLPRLKSILELENEIINVKNDKFLKKMEIQETTLIKIVA